MKYKVIFWVSTCLFSILIVWSVVMYNAQNTDILEAVSRFGVPLYMLIPIGILKLVGLVFLFSTKIRLLHKLVYLGFSINLGLAALIHFKSNTNLFLLALLGLLLLFISYQYKKKAFILEKGQ